MIELINKKAHIDLDAKDVDINFHTVVVNGGYYTPNVDEEGNLSWKPSKESMEDVEVVNIKGEDGKDGKSFTYEDFTPEQLEALKGKDGKDGKDGVNGRDGVDGYTPIKGVDYFDGKDGTNGRDGVDGKTPVKGVDYFDGVDGKDGVTPQFSIGTVTTLDPGVDATVTMTGTDEAPVLNFGIPKGEKGANGTGSSSSGGVGAKGTGTNAEIFNDYTNNKATGSYAHAEGYTTNAAGNYSHTEGRATKTTNTYAHAEGYGCEVAGSCGHAEGYVSKAKAGYSHAEGYECWASSDNQHVQGKFNVEDAEGKYAHIVGNGSSTSRKNAHTLDWDGNAWFRGKVYIGGTKQDDTTAKTLTTADDVTSIVNSSLGQGNLIGAAGTDTGAEIFNNYSKNVASSDYAHAEGSNTTASGNYSHAEGYKTTAQGSNSHAEGGNTLAYGGNSHAEGSQTDAHGSASHAEGQSTDATGSYSHAEGHSSVASGTYSHAEGWNTEAKGTAQHAQGKYNVIDQNNVFAHIVGNGSSTARSNCHTLEWDGTTWFAGDVYVGGTNRYYGKKLATEKYVDEKVAAGGGSGSADLSGYYTKTEADAKFITEVPAEYITETELNAKGYLTQHQSLSNYYTKGQVDAAIDAAVDGIVIPDVSGFITEIPEEYITETELNAKGYLTEHQSLDGYAKTEDIPDVSGFQTEAQVIALIQANMPASGDEVSY